jgi:predicted nuclease of predicted toxin-antitoxin system
MTFFLDINILASFAVFLEKFGHSVTIGVKSGFNGKSDWEVCEYARENKSIIVTHDLDFGELLAVSGTAGPSVIIFRLQPLTKEIMEDTFLRILQLTAAELNRGAIIVIEKDKFRLRRLPIGKY